MQGKPSKKEQKVAKKERKEKEMISKP